jgi:hypothetical protein
LNVVVDGDGDGDVAEDGTAEVVVGWGAGGSSYLGLGSRRLRDYPSLAERGAAMTSESRESQTGGSNARSEEEGAGAAARRLAIGGLDPRARGVQKLADELYLEVLTLSGDADVKALEAAPPIAVLVGAGSPIGEEVCRAVRLSSRLADLPVIAVVGKPWSGEVGRAFSFGVDDYVPVSGPELLEQKVRVVEGGVYFNPGELKYTVVLAHPSRERRVHLARFLRRMGLDVSFAAASAELAHDDRVRLVVAACELAPDGAAAGLRGYRAAHGGATPWIVAGEGEALEAARRELAEEKDVGFLDLSADAAQIVTLANKHLIKGNPSMRRSARLPYEAPIRYGRDEAAPQAWGYLFNVNLGGVYIRTLTPPPLGVELDLEFVPPKGRGRVLVRGSVVWSNEYSGRRGHPPGFGIKYEDHLPLADGAALYAGYQKLFEEHGNPSK